MKAFERYLAVYDDTARNKMDRVGTFVQYLKPDFIKKNKASFKSDFNGKMVMPKRQILFSYSRFSMAYKIGLDSIYAALSPNIWVKKIKVEDMEGNKVIIGESGQTHVKGSTYYHKGHIHSMEILDQLRSNMKHLPVHAINKKLLKWYENMSPHLYPVLTIGGIFDKVWQSMGMTEFSKNFRKDTPLYKEVVRYYADIAKEIVQNQVELFKKENTVRVITFTDDVAFKGRPMISPERWKQDYGPYYKEINSIISDAGLIPQIHTDGDVTQLIPSFQEAGFRGLQGWEGGCDPNYINEHYPDFVVIGFADVSDILPYGTKESIDTHVKMLMDALKENRHFIIGPSTVIFKEIPFENVLNFIESVKKYGKYN
jgi:hypothetical protein